MKKILIIWGIWAFVAMCLWVGGIYTLIHFIRKFW